MPFARASELDRLLECAGSAVLPRADHQPGYVKPMNAAVAAQWGTLCHRWKETGVYPDNIVYAKPMEAKVKKSGMDRLALWPVGPNGTGEHEVAMAYNVITRKAVRCVVPTGAAEDYKDHWKAGFDDEWVTGTLDYAGELMDAPWVDDLKTGRWFSKHDYAAQQAFYCMAWSLVKYSELRDTRSTLTHWPRYPVASPPQRYGKLLEAGYMADFQDKLVSLRAQVLRGRKDRTGLELAEGEHCRFCPSRGVCPKMVVTSNEGD